MGWRSLRVGGALVIVTGSLPRGPLQLTGSGASALEAHGGLGWQCARTGRYGHPGRWSARRGRLHDVMTPGSSCEQLYSAREVHDLGIVDDSLERVDEWVAVATSFGWAAKRGSSKIDGSGR